MILRKPYAFLIRNFKLVHIAMFMIFCYLLFQLRNIYIFFKDYVVSGTFTYVENMASNYIDGYMYILVLILILGTIVIYLLMRQKEKPLLFYKILFIYSIALMIMMIVYHSFFTSLEFKEYSRVTITIYRDIIGVLYYLNYFYIVFTFVRGFGFDIKKFSFDKDLKELNISERDSEEYEVALKVDTDKMINFVRREKRMIKYYIKENITILSIILAVILLIIGGGLYYKYSIKERVFPEQTVVSISDLDYEVLESHILKNDRYEELISNEKKYVVVKFKVTNNGKKNLILPIKSNRLMINENYYYPVLNRYNSFVDLGIGYKEQAIAANDSEKYIMVFEIEKNINIKKIYLDLYESIDNSDKQLKINYKRISLEPSDFSRLDIGTYYIGDEVNFQQSRLNMTTLKINKYEFNKVYVVETKNCQGDVCSSLTKVIQPSINHKIMKIDLNFVSEQIDVETFLNSYLSLKDGDKEAPASQINVLAQYDDILYLDVPANDYSNDLTFVFCIRGTLYSVKVK